MKKRDSFNSTMKKIYDTCFSETASNDSFDAVDYFLYLTKYRTGSDIASSYTAPVDRTALSKQLCNSSNIDPSPIPVLYDFLQLHLLDSHDNLVREERYLKRSFSQLTDSCSRILGLQEDVLKELTSDSLIDLFTVCMIAGCHGFSSPYLSSSAEKSSPFNAKFPSNFMQKNEELEKILKEKRTRFTVIYGNINDRTAHYMTQQIVHQLSDKSRHTSYHSYLSFSLPEDVTIWLKPRFENLIKQLYPALINAYLNYAENLYFIIHHIPSQEALSHLICDCQLLKNVILICDYDLECPVNTDAVSYIPFQSISAEPEPKKVRAFLQQNHITDDDNSFAEILLSISHKTPYILYAIELLIKKCGNDNDLKDIFSNLTLQADSNMLPKQKYNMSTWQNDTRSGYSLAGHIFRLYRSILTTDELLLLVFSALHQEDGLSEQWITSFLSENALQAMTSLVQKGFICKEGKAFYYIDSLLIPYAILYSGQFKEDGKNIMFSMTLSFCNSLLNELCYRNSNPVDYGILRATIRKTLKALFLILNKSTDQYYAHFTEIWYFHLRCTRFLLENGDLDTLRELHTDFCHVAKKLTSRPGKEYKAWKKLYDLYAKFLDIEISSAHNPDGSLQSISNIIEQTIAFVQRHGGYLFTRPDYSKILLSFIEMNLSGLLRLCVIGLRQNRFEISETEQINSFYDKMNKLHDICITVFSLKVLPDDKQFISEITVALNDIVLITEIYTKYFRNDIYIVELPYCPDLFESPRFEQLSWFRRNCILLSEQCCSGYVKSDIDRSYQAARLQTSLRYTYGKLAFVPLNILNDYYYSLIAYMLALAPQDHAKLYSYMYNDLKRYEHIWKQSQELLLLKEMMIHFISDISKSE